MQNVSDGFDMTLPLSQFFPFSVEPDLDSVSITAYNRAFLYAAHDYSQSFHDIFKGAYDQACL